MTGNKLMPHRNIVHKMIIVDLIINVILFLVSIIYAYQVMFRVSNPSGFMLPASLILLFVMFTLLSYDIVYICQNVKGDKTFGMSRIMAIASIICKVVVLLSSLVMVCFAGPEAFIKVFDMFL